MKLLLINAKPEIVDALAAVGGVNVATVWSRELVRLGIPLPQRVTTQFYCGGSKLNFRAAWQIRRMIRSQRPEFVHAFYARALAHTVLAVTGMNPRPRIVSFRGITSPLSRTNPGDWISYGHPLVDAHACESEAVRQSLVGSGVNSARCEVTFNSMLFPPARRPGRAGLRQFDIPGDAFVVGTVGTFRRVKGADLLLEAAIACADLPNVYWLLLGGVADPSVSRLAADPRIRDRVRLVGHQPHASELISGADLFVMPSRAEALCQALLEAMHQGVCPVVSDAGGMKEVVRNGVDGLVVPAEDVAALAAAVRKLHADRQSVARFAASAKRRISDQFTPNQVVERMMVLYQRLLSASRWAA